MESPRLALKSFTDLRGSGEAIIIRSNNNNAPEPKRLELWDKTRLQSISNEEVTGKRDATQREFIRALEEEFNSTIVNDHAVPIIEQSQAVTVPIIQQVNQACQIASASSDDSDQGSDQEIDQATDDGVPQPTHTPSVQAHKAAMMQWFDRVQPVSRAETVRISQSLRLIFEKLFSKDELDNPANGLLTFFAQPNYCAIRRDLETMWDKFEYLIEIKMVTYDMSLRHIGNDPTTDSNLHTRIRIPILNIVTKFLGYRNVNLPDLDVIYKTYTALYAAPSVTEPFPPLHHAIDLQDATVMNALEQFFISCWRAKQQLPCIEDIRKFVDLIANIQKSFNQVTDPQDQQVCKHAIQMLVGCSAQHWSAGEMSRMWEAAQDLQTLSINNIQGQIKSPFDAEIQWIRDNDPILPNLEKNGEFISDKDMADLAKALQGNTVLQSIRLINCSITSKGVLELAQAIKNNKCLEELDLSGNEIDNAGATELAKMLNPNRNAFIIRRVIRFVKDASLPHLLDESSRFTTLNLSHNLIANPGAEALAKALDDVLAHTKLNLDLGWNKIGYTGKKNLSKFKNVSVREQERDRVSHLTEYKINQELNRGANQLNFSGLTIDNDYMRYLCIKLVKDTKHTELNLSNVQFGNAGIGDLVNLIKKNKHLTDINLKNVKNIGLQGKTTLLMAWISRLIKDLPVPNRPLLKIAWTYRL